MLSAWFFNLVQSVFHKCWKLFLLVTTGTTDNSSSKKKTTTVGDGVKEGQVAVADATPPSLFPKTMMENILSSSGPAAKSVGPTPCSTDQTFNLVQLTSPNDGTLIGWDTIDNTTIDNKPHHQQEPQQKQTVNNFYPDGFFEHAINNTNVAAADVARSDSYSSFTSPPELEQDFYTSPNSTFFSDSELPFFPPTTTTGGNYDFNQPNNFYTPQIHSRGNSDSQQSTTAAENNEINGLDDKEFIWNNLLPFEQQQQQHQQQQHSGNMFFFNDHNIATPSSSDSEQYAPIQHQQQQIQQHVPSIIPINHNSHHHNHQHHNNNNAHPISPPMTASPSSSNTPSSSASSPKSKDNNTPFMCPNCGAAFRIKGYLTRHMKKHATKKAYNCPFYDPNAKTTCHPSGGFSRRDTYKTHLKARHFLYPTGTRSENRSKVPGCCSGCQETFESNEQWVEEHIQKKKCKAFISL